MKIKIGQRVEIDHPYYGQRIVVVLDVDEPKYDDQNTCYDCEIDGHETWFDDDMIVRLR